MLGQTFQIADLGVVAVLIVLEAMLSADNALVLAMTVRHLPSSDHKKALLYGLGGAFVLRFAAILLASVVMRQWWLQAVGAIYLVWMAIRHFRGRSKSAHRPNPTGFWQTVIAVELTDLAFAVDSVLAGIALIRGAPEKIWIVYLGGMIGIILLRIAAGALIHLLRRFPAMDAVAYLIVGWVGVKLAFAAADRYGGYGELSPTVFWCVLGFVGVVGSIWATTRPHKDRNHGEIRDESMPNG